MKLGHCRKTNLSIVLDHVSTYSDAAYKFKSHFVNAHKWFNINNAPDQKTTISCVSCVQNHPNKFF